MCVWNIACVYRVLRSLRDFSFSRSFDQFHIQKSAILLYVHQMMQFHINFSIWFIICSLDTFCTNIVYCFSYFIYMLHCELKVLL